MKSRTMRPLVSISAVLAAVVITATAAAVAQAPAQPAAPPQRIQISTTQLKPDMVLTWEDLVKNEMIPAQKKVGLAWRHTLGNGASGQQFVRVTVNPLANYAQLDMPAILQRAVSAEANANYNAKIRATIESQRTSIATLQVDQSIMSNSATMSPLFVVQTVVLAPGKAADFAASMREDYLAAYRKAGVKDFWVYVINQGDIGVLLVRPVANYAELDKPGLLAQARLTEEQQNKIGARRNATLAGGIKTEVFRFIPELSYGMPAPARQTN